MPLVLLEAMACGATVLATRAAAAGLPDGSALAIVEAPGATGIATGLRPLLRDPELRARTGRAAVALVHERYPASRVVDQYDDLVRTLTTDAVPDPLPAGEPQTA
jgi:glycosyltransferase involved in cell wall biosynthesis